VKIKSFVREKIGEGKSWHGNRLAEGWLGGRDQFPSSLSFKTAGASQVDTSHRQVLPNAFDGDKIWVRNGLTGQLQWLSGIDFSYHAAGNRQSFRSACTKRTETA